MNHLQLLISLMALMTMGQNTSSGLEAVPVSKTLIAQAPVSGSDIADVPSSVNISVPFFSQAPLGDWNAPWQDACEEASVLLAANYYFSRNWDAQQFSEQILNVIEWEKQNLGVFIDTSISQNVQILNNYLGLKTVVYTNPSLSQIKRILASGHVIVISASGKVLNNPNYLNGGPRYHVILIKGYTADNRIITHDVGSSRGADYIYDWATINDAMHDLADPIENGAKKIIEVLPPTGGF